MLRLFDICDILDLCIVIKTNVYMFGDRQRKQLTRVIYNHKIFQNE